MSVDLEKYAEIYGKFGDGDIQRLLLNAALLSRRRGRPDVLFLQDRNAVYKQEEQVSQEINRKLYIQRMLVSFFSQETPVGTSRSIYDTAEAFYDEVGRALAYEEPISYALLPTRDRLSTENEEQLLFQESRTIAPKIKTTYNRMLQTCMRAGLITIGDIRKAATLDGEFLMKPIPSKTAMFLQTAF